MQSKSYRELGQNLLKPITRKLNGFLSHTNSRLRNEAANALASIGDSESVIPLVDALLREKQDECVPLALSVFCSQEVLNALLDAFVDSENKVKPNIALALGAYKDKKAASLLIDALNDADPNVRYNSITALGMMKEYSAVSPLLGCLGESNEWLFQNVRNCRQSPFRMESLNLRIICLVIALI